MRKFLLTLALAVGFTACETFEEDVIRLEADVAQYQSIVQALTEELNSAIAEGDATAVLLADAELTIVGLNESVASLTASNTLLSDSLDFNLAKVESLTATIAEINAEIADLIVQRDALLAQSELDVAAIQDLTDQIAELEAREPEVIIETVTEFVTIIETVVETVVETVTETVTEEVIVDNTDYDTIAELQSQLASLQTLLDEAVAAKDAAGVDNAELDATIADLNSQISGLNAQISALSTQVENQGNAIATMTTQISDLNAQIATLAANQEDGISQADVDAVQAIVDSLQAQLDAITPEDGVSQADVDAAKAELQALLDAANATIATLTADLATANDTIATLQGEAADLNSQIATLTANQEDGITQADVDAVQAIVDGLQAQLDAIVPEDGISQSDVDAVQAELDAANDKIKELEDSIAEYSYAINVGINGDGLGGVVTGGGNYFNSQEATLTAVADEGYVFVRWHISSTSVSVDVTDSEITFVVDRDLNVFAEFDVITPVYDVTFFDATYGAHELTAPTIFDWSTGIVMAAEVDGVDRTGILELLYFSHSDEYSFQVRDGSNILQASKFGAPGEFLTGEQAWAYIQSLLD